MILTAQRLASTASPSACTRLTENDDLRWPHRDGLIWPHFSSVVVDVDVA
jgi:hypothetical protein